MITGLKFLQTLRLRVQIEAPPAKRDSGQHTDASAHANMVDVPALNAIDRHVLSEALRLARQLQLRPELGHRR